jgi:hypothetical protein
MPLPHNQQIVNPQNQQQLLPNNQQKLLPQNIQPPSFNYNIYNTNSVPVNNSYYVANKHNSDLLIGIKPKSDELIVFDPRQLGFVTVKVNKNNFQDPSRSFSIFPDNCRYVNLGFSILMTGGYLNKQPTNICHLIVLSKKENYQNISDSYDLSIMPYSNMIEARERHNIINLHDRNSVLVCSGFFNSNSEITDINAGTWKQLPKMNDVRANSSIAYTNNRYVWVFGGFKINEKQVGVYQNSGEVLDLNTLNQGWSFINFEKLNYNMKLSAMGVIYTNDTSILLCGGYDGSQYRKDVTKVDVNEKTISKVEKINLVLPGNYIFTHNAFVRIDDYGYNFDLQMNAIQYNPNDLSFKVIYSL